MTYETIQVQAADYAPKYYIAHLEADDGYSPEDALTVINWCRNAFGPEFFSRPV